jgi:hypothetical protein
MSDARATDGKADVWQFVTPQPSVHNVRETQAYHRDVLGFKIAWIYDEDYGAIYNGTTESYFSRVEGPVVPPNEWGNNE